jgi:hypothetical protein
MFWKKKKIERVCGNCRLFNPEINRCSVVVLFEGQKTNIPVDPEDSCFFEEDYFDPKTGEKSDFNEIKEIKMWVEDENGQKAKEGQVKIQLPTDEEIMFED